VSTELPINKHRSHEPPCKPPLDDPPDEGDDTLDMPIDHTPEECE
jgi:hypothetical protein